MNSHVPLSKSPPSCCHLHGPSSQIKEDTAAAPLFFAFTVRTVSRTHGETATLDDRQEATRTSPLITESSSGLHSPWTRASGTTQKARDHGTGFSPPPLYLPTCFPGQAFTCCALFRGQLRGRLLPITQEGLPRPGPHKATHVESRTDETACTSLSSDRPKRATTPRSCGSSTLLTSVTTLGELIRRNYLPRLPRAKHSHEAQLLV